jgi:hypothetical protein
MQSEWHDDSIGESENAPGGNVEKANVDDKSIEAFNERNSIFRKNGFRNWKLSLRPVERAISSHGWTCLKTDYPLQTDSINCGAYVVLILSRLMDGQCEERVSFGTSAEDLVKHRKEIYATLEQNATYI